MLQAKFAVTTIAMSLISFTYAQSPQVPKLPATIPFVMKSDLPVVRVGIGDTQFELLLDLGGYHGLAIASDVLAKVPVTLLKGSDRVRDSDGKAYQAKRFLASNVIVEGVPVGDLIGGEFPANSLPKPLKGFIGWGFLKQYLLVLDYNARELRLYDRADTDALRRECGSNQFKIDIENSTVVSMFHTERGDLKFHWDTGSSRNVLQQTVIDDPLLSSTWLREFRVSAANIRPTQFDVREFAAPKTHGVLGTPFFESRTTCFDFVRRVGAIRENSNQ